MPDGGCAKEGRTVRGEIAIAERPTSSRRRFTPYPTPLRDPAGEIVGGINILLDLTDRSDTDRSAELLAALVDSSIDGIINEHVYRFIQSCSHPEHRDSMCASCGLLIGKPGESSIELHVECYQKTRFNSANREAEAWNAPAIAKIDTRAFAPPFERLRNEGFVSKPAAVIQCLQAVLFD